MASRAKGGKNTPPRSWRPRGRRRNKRKAARGQGERLKDGKPAGKPGADKEVGDTEPKGLVAKGVQRSNSEQQEAGGRRDAKGADAGTPRKPRGQELQK